MGQASFLIPVVDGKIWVGKRGTEPHKGLWGALGGKAEPVGNHLFEDPEQHVRPSLMLDIPLVDRIRRRSGKEYTHQTAVRESCEEVFVHLQYPEDFSKGDITDIAYLGSLDDFPEGDGNSVFLTFHLAKIRRTDLRLSVREIHCFKPLEELTASEEIWPMTQYALTDLKVRLNPKNHLQTPPFVSYLDLDLPSQIPDMDLPLVETSMGGLHVYFNRKARGAYPYEPGDDSWVKGL